MREKSSLFGLKNCNLGSTDSGKYPNSVPTHRLKAEGFYEQEDGGDCTTQIKERRILSIGTNRPRHFLLHTDGQLCWCYPTKYFWYALLNSPVCRKSTSHGLMIKMPTIPLTFTSNCFTIYKQIVLQLLFCPFKRFWPSSNEARQDCLCTMD